MVSLYFFGCPSASSSTHRNNLVHPDPLQAPILEETSSIFADSPKGANRKSGTENGRPRPGWTSVSKNNETNIEIGKRDGSLYQWLCISFQQM